MARHMHSEVLQVKDMQKHTHNNNKNIIIHIIIAKLDATLDKQRRDWPVGNATPEV